MSPGIRLRFVRNAVSRFGLAAACMCLLLHFAVTAGHAQAQTPDDDPPTNVTELLTQQAQELGASYGEYKQLQQQRRQTIARLEKEVAACGRCADGPRLRDELGRARAADGAVNRAEADALAGMGLPQFSSIDEMLAAAAKGLAGKHDFGSQYTNERIGTTISDHCRAGRSKFDVGEMVQCTSRLDQRRQLAMFTTALTYCQQRAGKNYLELCRSSAVCEAFESCMRVNSEAVSMCADNMSKGYTTPKAGRCFTWMLHPGIFAGSGMGSEDRAAQRAEQARQAEGRAAERRARICPILAKQLEASRDSAQRRPSYSTKRQLERNEAGYAANCGG